MAQYEEKFIIINRKHLEKLNDTNPKMVTKFLIDLDTVVPYLPENKYYVCNQDEPYADKVIKTILDGETAKEQLPTPQGVQNGGSIDVWRIEAKGLGAYYENDIRMIVDMLKECDEDDGYIITKHKMDKLEYENLPEFMGF